jgi:predicted TIM-barrel fold metal-dependent hydrolase
MPFPKPGQEPWVVPQFRDLLRRHPQSVVIWAHAGVGRIVHPIKDQLAMMERGLADPQMKNVNIDISWTELAKYIVATPDTTAAAADLINRYSDRFIFGTDEVAPADQASYLKIVDVYRPLFARLTPETKQKVLKGNYERVFDEARRKVRAWETAHVK